MIILLLAAISADHGYDKIMRSAASKAAEDAYLYCLVAAAGRYGQSTSIAAESLAMTLTRNHDLCPIEQQAIRDVWLAAERAQHPTRPDAAKASADAGRRIDSILLFGAPRAMQGAIVRLRAGRSVE